VSSWSLAAAGTGAYSTTAGIWTPPMSPESCLARAGSGGGELPPADAGALGERSPISFTAG